MGNNTIIILILTIISLVIVFVVTYILIKKTIKIKLPDEIKNEEIPDGPPTDEDDIDVLGDDEESKDGSNINEGEEEITDDIMDDDVVDEDNMTENLANQDEDEDEYQDENEDMLKENLVETFKNENNYFL